MLRPTFLILTLTVLSLAIDCGVIDESTDVSDPTELSSKLLQACEGDPACADIYFPSGPPISTTAFKYITRGLTSGETFYGLLKLLVCNNDTTIEQAAYNLWLLALKSERYSQSTVCGPNYRPTLEQDGVSISCVCDSVRLPLSSHSNTALSGQGLRTDVSGPGVPLHHRVSRARPRSPLLRCLDLPHHAGPEDIPEVSR
jgi:hypothetical protein